MEEADTVDIEAVVRLHRSGRLAEARAGYLDLLQIDPANADLLNYLGLLEFQSGDSARGIELVEKCIALDAAHVPACNNLANMYLTTYRLADAEQWYQRAIALDDRAVEPLHNMAVIEKARRNYSRAEQYLNQVLTLDPDHVVSIRALADLYTGLEHFPAAFALLKSALHKATDPDTQKATVMSLARLCMKMQEPEAAADLYRQLLALAPDDAEAEHMLAAVTGQAVPARSDQRYISNLFDRFASTFDSVLNRLDYQVPRQIQAVVDELYGDRLPGSLLIIDAGCGTGLCGVGLRPLASRLIGVDLSAGMLGRARYRQVYDDLIEQDLIAYLQAFGARADLIVCADTLCYFGDLRPALQAARSALKPGAHLVFTVERQEGDSSSDYHLQVNGRYSHSRKRLELAIDACGFRTLVMHEPVLRWENGLPVQGLLPVLERSC